MSETDLTELDGDHIEVMANGETILAIHGSSSLWRMSPDEAEVLASKLLRAVRIARHYKDEW